MMSRKKYLSKNYKKTLKKYYKDMLKKTIKYKSEGYSKKFIQIDRFNPSSKLCNVCRYKKH